MGTYRLIKAPPGHSRVPVTRLQHRLAILQVLHDMQSNDPIVVGHIMGLMHEMETLLDLLEIEKDRPDGN